MVKSYIVDCLKGFFNKLKGHDTDELYLLIGYILWLMLVATLFADKLTENMPFGVELGISFRGNLC